MKNIETYGQVAYEGYCSATGGISLISKAPLPPWESLYPEIKSAWEVAALAVQRELNKDKEPDPKI